MNNLTIKGKELEEILDDYSLEYACINSQYKYIGVDHDLWEFQAIIQRVSDEKFFSVNWFDSYSCNWEELGLDEDDFELTEVFPKQVLTTVYE